MDSKITPRDYQIKAEQMLYDWFGKNKTGNPVVDMPGGSGKSVSIALFLSGIVKKWPSLRVLMLVHSKELIEQNAAKMRLVWPGAPMGVYSSSLNKRELGEPITYAGIGSVAKRSQQIGHIDVMVVDECHAINNTEAGQYRNLISELKEINPRLRVVGFTASPYRTGQGMVTDGDLFDDILSPVTIKELVKRGHLSPLNSKCTIKALETDDLKKYRGDFQAKAMEMKFNTKENNSAVAQEVIERAKDRKHWLVFCSGIQHAKDFSEELNANGIKSEYLTGKDSKTERERKIKSFESGEIKALCNVDILTTGYDFPALDCIALLRATMSPGLYLQIVVRGMRTAPKKDNCLVLDFCGNVARHGPVINVRPPKKKGEKGGDAPVKICPECDEILHAAAKDCSCCGYEFPVIEKKYTLGHECIMGEVKPETLPVRFWKWTKHTSKKTEKQMLKATYFVSLSHEPVIEYFFLKHDEPARSRSVGKLKDICIKAGAPLTDSQCGSFSIDILARFLNDNTKPPSSITVTPNGRFYNVDKREWAQ